MTNLIERREFLQSATTAGAVFGLTALPWFGRKTVADHHHPKFKISLAQWSLHRTLRRGKLEHLEFPAFTKKEFGITAVEYVNQFFKDKAQNQVYLKELKSRASDAGVNNLLIMIDGEGALGDRDDVERKKAVENHYPWVEAARFLGCHSIRVNARSEGTFDQQQQLAADGLRKLSEFGDQHQINVIVENHGGLSSNGKWLSGVIEKVDHPRCGTLPDFGNFHLGTSAEGQDQWYDRYRGVKELMPYAKAVSAKSKKFDDQGNEVETDYFRMMAIVLAAGYRGYVGIEWEGNTPNEVEGIRLTQKLLEHVRDKLS
jgi:sugar phosphate isomerase/epimerase